VAAPDGDGRVQQTVGQGAWHDALRAVFTANPDRNAYLNALVATIEATLWDGGLDFLPEPLQPLGIASGIAVDYRSKAGADLGSELVAMGEKVGKTIENTVKMIKGAKSTEAKRD